GCASLNRRARRRARRRAVEPLSSPTSDIGSPTFAVGRAIRNRRNAGYRTGSRAISYGGAMSGLPRYAEPVVGFDLDMTLVDTSAAMMVAVRAVNRELGVAVDVDACVRAMGAPQRQQFSEAVPAEKLDAAMSVLARAFL